MHVTQLASGTINGADELSIELREADDAPATIWIVWPSAPTITTPAPRPRGSYHGHTVAR
jgi:hypothetical protein